MSNQAGAEDRRRAVTIAIPTLNEEEAIGPLLEEIKGFGYNDILVVDGHSSDKTTDIARSHGAAVLEQGGRGKAGALLTAFENVKTKVCIVMDGDGTYDPGDLDKFLAFVGKSELAKGERAKNENMSHIRRIGNSVITWQFNRLFGTNLRDVCSGMYMMDMALFKTIRLETHPMAAEQEIAAQAVRSGMRIATVPIGYRKRGGGRSKTHTWRQGLTDLWTNVELRSKYRM